MSKPNLPTDVAVFARRIFGPAQAIREVGSGAGPVRTYRWNGPASHGYVKTYRSVRTFRQERDAYRHWAPRLPDVPELLGVNPRPTPALAMSALAGEPVATETLAAADERGLHEAAGAWLRQLHALPHVDDDPVTLDEAYRMRWSAAWEVDAGPSSRSRLRRWVGETLERAVPAIGGVRVPCHRDYQPANWLADRRGRWVGAIDFEHARPDHPLADVARLAAYVWPDRPDLEGAFRAGYGTLRGDGATVRAFAVAEAWHRWWWARRHGDAAFARSAGHALLALGAPVDPDDLAYPDP